MGAEQTRAAYDATADVYLERIGGSITLGVEQQVELDLLDDFAADLPRPARVADLGCGPGRMCAYLRERGLEVVGVDLSIEMLRNARRVSPGTPLLQGDLAALPLRDGAFDAAVLWYSIIHSSADLLPGFFADVRRVLVVGAPVILGFQSGAGEVVHRDQIGGRAVSMTNVRHSPAVVVAALDQAGFRGIDVTTRDALGDLESTPQSFVRARA